MASYAGYQGYDPERAKVERTRQMAEMLQQGVTSGPTNVWGGLSRLGQAWLAQDSRKEAEKTEKAYGTDKARRLAQFLNPNADEQGRNMAPDVNVSADPAPAPAQGNPNIRALATALGGVYEGTGKTQPMGMTAAPMADVGAPSISMSEPVSMPMSAPQMPKPAPDRVAALRQALQMTGGDFEQARSLVEAKLGPAPKPIEINGQLVDPNTREVLGDYRTAEKPNDGSNIRQVGNQIVERQQDGSWKPVYTGSNAEETARAFQGFIDANTGEQMVVMSNGVARGTGRTAYIPAQITDMGGVPTAVDKRTLGTTPLAPVAGVAGNKAAISSADVQGRAQGQAAFDLPTIEMRSQAAMRSVDDLKGRNIGTRFGMQGKLYAIPGTEGADVQALIGQVTSQAFLNAFDQLRGAGAITEREGQAATAAITRLQNQNITIGEALKAMDELQQYYKTGLNVARMKSTKAPVLPDMPAGAQGSADLSKLSTEELQRMLAQAGGQ